MKYLKILPLLLLPLFAAAQPLGTWPVQYGDTPPTHTPSGSGTRIYLNISTNELYNWNPAPVSSWVKYPKGFDQISGCAAPGYMPTARQSVFAVNSCTALQNGRGPELYQYTGSQWVCLNCYPAYTAGTGIGISSGVITNTAPDQVVSISGVGITPSGTYPNFTLTAADQSSTNELQTLSLVGQNLTLSNGGGTVAIPGGTTISEPYKQVLFGGVGGVGADSDTGFVYSSRKAAAPNLKILSTTNDSTGIIYEGDIKMIHFYTADNDSIVGDNIFIGRDAGNFTLGYEVEKYESKRNIGIGKLALNKVTTGYFNTVIGWESCKELTTGAGNIVVGNHALEILETGHDNAAIGDAAMKKNQTGWYNQAIGYESLYENVSGDGNAAIGRGAGSALTGGDYNTFLGYGSNTNSGIAATVTNSTALGANATITKSNQVVLGANTVTEILAPATIVAAKTGTNLRLVADGTDGADAGIYVGSTGDINFGNWNSSRGFGVAAITGNITQFGTGTFRTNRLGVNGSAHATHALAVSGTSTFSGVATFANTGNNVRLGSSSGTTANDGFLGVGGANNVLIGNYDLTRGFDIKSTGIIEQIGNYAMKLGTGAGVPSGSVGLIKHNTATGSFQGVAVGTVFTDFVQSQSVNPISNGTTSAPDASAQLDIVSTTKGVLLPRITTTQRNAISSPATGLTIYCTNCTATDTSTGVMQTYNGSTWKNHW